MLFARDFRQIGRDCLAGNWGVAIGTGLVASILGASIAGASIEGSSFPFNFNYRFSSGDFTQNFNLTKITSFFVVPFLSSMLLMALIISVLRFIIGCSVTLGYTEFNLDIIDQSNVEFKTLFSKFNQFGSAVCMQLLRYIFTFLWTLLFIIPGIIAAYSYSMAAYILVEHPEMSAREAISESKQLMDGYKWRLFCLEFSFIGWYLLCIPTFGLLLIWLVPYVEASRAAFYREISNTSVDANYDPNAAYNITMNNQRNMF